MASDKLVVTVSVTGGFGSADTPYLPITPKQIAESAVEAGQAGASVAHIHVRNPETGLPSMEFELYKEVFERIRDHSDILINLTLGAGARVIPDNNDPIGIGPGSTLCQPQKRVEHVVRLKPELCSLDVGSMDFGPHVFVNYSKHVEWMAEQVLAAGVKPEMEVFSLGHVEIGKRLIETQKIKEPPIFQLCMGIQGGIPATPLNMIALKEALPPNAIWAGFGIAHGCFPMVAQATLLGGNVRVGMEDNLYLQKGVRAKTNAELVQKAVSMIRLLGKEPATPQEARKLLYLE